MKFLFYLLVTIVTISSTLGNNLRCFNCYHSSDNQTHMEIAKEFNKYLPNYTSTDMCSIKFGKISGPLCEDAISCVSLVGDAEYYNNSIKLEYHYCAELNIIGNGNLRLNISKNVTSEMKFKVCSTNLCNGASSIFTVALLAIVLILLFS